MKSALVIMLCYNLSLKLHFDFHFGLFGKSNIYDSGHRDENLRHCLKIGLCGDVAMTD